MQKQNKRTPLRTCKGCGEMKPKTELIRVVKTPNNEISFDIKGKKPGRGIYVCKSLDCLKKARKKRCFERDFSCQIPTEVYEGMERELKESSNFNELGEPINPDGS